MPEQTPSSALRVLLVADATERSSSLCRQLERLGYVSLGPAVCCDQALDLGVRLTPDLLLIDDGLSLGASPIETAAMLRECLELPLIYLAEHIDHPLLQQLGEIDSSGCLLLPVRDADLLAALELAGHQSRREQRLITRERWMATSFDSLEEALIAIDADGLVRFANPMAQKLFNCEPDHLLGQPLQGLYRMEYTARQTDWNRGRLEGLLTRRDGQVIPVEETRSGIFDKAGGRTGTMVVLRDITQRRQTESSLRQSLDELHQVLTQTVNALAVSSEQRDPFTAGHQQRVSTIAVAIAKEMGLSATMQEGVRVAGLVHDIGKIHIPSEILAKSGPLTELERQIMRQHSEVGYQILKDVAFPWPVARMVLEHHERQNGSGYPAGLCGDAILLEARILAVADVMEAMTSHRPYRPALGLDQALAEITDKRGTLYDSVVVDACLRVCQETDILHVSAA